MVGGRIRRFKMRLSEKQKEASPTQEKPKDSPKSEPTPRLANGQKFLKDSRDNLTSCCICSEGCYKTKHCCPTVELFCFRCHRKRDLFM